MKKTEQISFRVTEAQKKMLTEMSDTTGLSETDIITGAIKATHQYFLQNGGRIAFPIDFNVQITIGKNNSNVIAGNISGNKIKQIKK